MKHILVGKKIAILVTDGFEQSELEKPRAALDLAGAKTEIVSPNPDLVRGWDVDDFGESFPVDVKLSAAVCGKLRCTAPARRSHEPG